LNKIISVQIFFVSTSFILRLIILQEPSPLYNESIWSMAESLSGSLLQAKSGQENNAVKTVFQFPKTAKCLNWYLFIDMPRTCVNLT